MTWTPEPTAGGQTTGAPPPDADGAARALRESEERYRTLFTNMTEGFALGEAICDGAGVPCDFRFLEMNDAFERQSGLNRAAVAGRPMREILPLLEQGWVDTYGAIAIGAPARRFESYNRDLDRHFSVYCFSPTHGQFAILFTDVTEHRRAEEALRDADRRKDEFLATLAHELRNPLAPIRFALRLLSQAGTDGPAAERSREVIVRQVDQLIRLVDDLLDVSRMTRNKVRLRKERVNLRTLLDTAIESTEPHLKAAGHRLVVRVDGVDAELHADATRLVQVFANLLNNAVKFTPPGGEITVSAETAGDYVVVAVRDSGIGIPAEILPRIFDMFHQADSSPDRASGGLGIGLTIAKRLVELHGGSVAASSDGPNRGAEFLVRLPLATPASGRPQRDLAMEGDGQAPHRMRVLVVDDNVDSADMLSLLVGTLGHETRTVHDGRRAVEAFAEFLPDAVLLDIGLPGVSGYDVARELRRTHGHGCYLIAITGWGQDEDRRRARAAGFDCHLTKPADPRTVERLLAAVSAGVHCDGCSRCLHTPLGRIGDVDAPTPGY